MNDYNYIKLAVHGQYDGEVRTLYTYPSTDAAAWENVLFDPTSVIKNFLNARECYVMWNNPSGHFFSLITRNPLEARTGYLLLTLRVDDGYSLTGRQIVNTLSALKKTLLEDGDRFDDAVTRCLEAVGIPHAGIRLDSWHHAAAASSPVVSGMCYRTYVSGQELETILSFPEQPDYNRFEKVIIIQATASLRPGLHIERVTSPVRKIYSLILPQGVTAAKTVVTEGERVTLTFAKPGFNSRRESIIAGVPSPYVRYEGSAIRVKSPAESGMSFVRRVKLQVKSAKGGIVTGYTINVNGRPVNTMEPYLELSEHEMTPGSHTEINVASNNYRPLKVVKDSASLAAMETLELVLEPMEQGIRLRLDFGEGRIFEQNISIEKNTPEYSQLHSGYFHGFRAHRMTTPGGAEVYNVDVRASNRPTAPVFDNVSDRVDTTQQRTKAPVFENVTRNSASAFGRKDDDKVEEKSRNTSSRPAVRIGGNNLAYIIGAILAVAIIVLAFVFILPGGNDKKADADVENTDSLREATSFSGDPAELSKEAADKAAKEAEVKAKEEAKPQEKTDEPSAPAAGSIADEDVTYLNGNNSWKLADLKSQPAKDLIAAMQSGNIDAIVSNPFFKNAAKGKADKVADMLWKAKGSPNEAGNLNALKKNVTAEGVNLHQLYEDLARVQPAKDKTNKAPRP